MLSINGNLLAGAVAEVSGVTVVTVLVRKRLGQNSYKQY